jgi:hypothetical protein
VHQLAVGGGDPDQGAGLQLQGLGRANLLAELPGGDVNKQEAPGCQDPVQFPAIGPKGPGVAVADGVDAENEIEGRGGEGKVLQVGLGEPERQGTGVKEGLQVPDDGPLPVQAQDPGTRPGPGAPSGARRRSRRPGRGGRPARSAPAPGP